MWNHAAQYSGLPFFQRSTSVEAYTAICVSTRKVTTGSEDKIRKDLVQVFFGLHYASSRVVIAHDDTKWFWELFPTVYTWLRKGIRITAFAKPSDGAGSAERKEGQRRNLIKQFGINLIETTTLPFEGILIDHSGTSSSRAVILPPDSGDYLPYARQYSGRSDETLLAALSDKVKDEALAGQLQPVNPMTRLDGAELLDLIKHVRAYSHPSVKLSIEEIRVTDVKLISRFVRAYHQSGREYSTLTRRAVRNLELVGLSYPSPDDHMVSLHSEFRYNDHPLHLPMLDFHCQSGLENELVVRRICAKLFNSTYLLIASGQSYHAISMSLCTTDCFVTLLSRALLYAPFIDRAYISHQLIERGAALRINRTSNKPTLPTVIEIVAGSIRE